MRREANKRIEIKPWTKTHRCPAHGDLECAECLEPILYGRYVRRVMRVHSRKGTREFTHLEVHREHECCPDHRRS